MEAGVIPLLGLHDTFAALEAASAPTRPAWAPWPAAPEAEGVLLDEAEGKSLIKASGVRVPASVTAAEIAQLDPAGLLPPFVLKGLGFPHKSESGAVRLGLRDVSAEPPMSGATGYLLEEMVVGSVAEVLIGLRRDPVYGATLTVGLGGVTTEILADTATLVLPASADDVEAAFRQLRLWPLLDGYRGRPTADVSAVVDVVLRLQDMMAGDQSLTEIEINPLMVCERGAVAVDALVRRQNNV